MQITTAGSDAGWRTAKVCKAIGLDRRKPHGLPLAGADIRSMMSARFAAANLDCASAIASGSFASRNRRPHRAGVCASPRWKSCGFPIKPSKSPTAGWRRFPPFEVCGVRGSEPRLGIDHHPQARRFAKSQTSQDGGLRQPASKCLVL